MANEAERASSERVGLQQSERAGTSAASGEAIQKEARTPQTPAEAEGAPLDTARQGNDTTLEPMHHFTRIANWKSGAEGTRPSGSHRTRARGG